VLACAALARDFLTDRVKSVLTRKDPVIEASACRRPAESGRPRSPASPAKERSKTRKRRR
jgi:hypothetical protein